MAQLSPNFSPAQLGPALEYINKHWLELAQYKPHDEGSLIGLPRPYVVPSRVDKQNFAFEELYYWDSYFIAQGLYGTRREQLAYDMLDDLLHLQKRFGLIPNGSRYYLTSRSQPPLLTSFILEVYTRGKKSKRWLSSSMTVAKEEYRRVWMGTQHPHWRQVFAGLSRYYDTNVLHELAEAESGWDMNPRFGGRCLDYIPIDLNALLFKYEQDFATAAQLLGNHEEAADWNLRAANRKAAVDRYLWNEEAGFYFDYDYQTGHHSPVWSLAAYAPLWAGMCSPQQAARLSQHLTKFELDGGLVTTTAESPVVTLPRQWEYPNGWAPLHWLVVHGLQRYHFAEDAERIARKWMATNLTVFASEGVFLEKYNVIDPVRPPKEGVYPSQRGFGWSNAIFYRFAYDYLSPHELPATTSHKRLNWRSSRLNLAWER